MTFRTPRPRALPRRDFLRACAATSLGSLLPARLARAGGTAPRNLLLVYHPNGLERGWEPEPGRALRLSTMLSPFAGLESKMVVLSGLKGGIYDEPAAHSEGMVSLWTGTVGHGLESAPTHASVDQRLADQLGGTAFRTLELGVQSVESAAENVNITSYDSALRPVPPEDDPAAAFERIFGGVGEAGAARNARRVQLLGAVGESVRRVRDLYGVAEERCLQAHLDAIRSVEQRLARLGDLGACGGEAPAPRGALYDTRLFPELVDLQSDLAVRALACGATRVLNLQLSYSSNNLRIPGVNESAAFHNLMHEGTPEQKRAINRFFVEKVAALVHQLEATPGAGEGTLLDETLVVWGTEMSIGNHGNLPIPFFVFGATETLRGGQHLVFGAESRPRHTRLLESIAPLVCLEPVGRFGHWSDAESQGVLEELLR